MTRGRFTDFMQSHHFHLMDVSISFPPVLIPTFGFTTVTAPELSADIQEIKEIVNEFPRKVIKGASTNTLTCSRGSRTFDGDFWNWVISCVKGQGGHSKRKNLVLVQLLEADLTKSAAAGVGGVLTGASAATISAVTAAQQSDLLTGIGTGVIVAANLALVSSGILPAGIGGEGSSIGGSAGIVSRPPGKIWMLYNCIATRLKAAADFDANSADISLMELDIQYESFEEFSLDPVVALGIGIVDRA